MRDALAEVKEKFQQALASNEAHGNSFSSLGKTFHVDQARRLLTNADGAPNGWARWQGKQVLSTEKRVDRGRLSLYVGSNRFTLADTAFLAFADIISGLKLRNWSETPNVFNLFLITGVLAPDRDLPIWVTAARMLELGSEENLYKVLPPLHTEFDLLHEELPADAEPEYRLRPSESTNRQSWSAYQARLLAQVLPDVASEAEKVTGSEEQVLLFQTHAPRLQQYVREQLFTRLAAAIAAAGGLHVTLASPEE